MSLCHMLLYNRQQGPKDGARPTEECEDGMPPDLKRSFQCSFWPLLSPDVKGFRSCPVKKAEVADTSGCSRAQSGSTDRNGAGRVKCSKAPTLLLSLDVTASNSCPVKEGEAAGT